MTRSGQALVVMHHSDMEDAYTADGNADGDGHGDVTDDDNDDEAI